MIFQHYEDPEIYSIKYVYFTLYYNILIPMYMNTHEK